MIVETVKIGIISGLVGVLSGALGAWYLTAEYKDAKHESYVNTITAKAAERYAELLKESQEKARKDRERVKLLEADYEKQGKEYADYVESVKRDKRGWRLRVNIPSESCRPAEAGKEGSTERPAIISVEAGVPDEIRKNLRELMIEADNLVKWGQLCYKTVNLPSCVC